MIKHTQIHTYKSIDVYDNYKICSLLTKRLKSTLDSKSFL